MTDRKKTVSVDIKSRWSDRVLFSAEVDVGERWRVKAALEIAVRDGANLRHANLVGADLDLAYLVGANLDGADLGGAYLDGANLGGANLRRANLVGANLNGAYLIGADLIGADLGGAYLNDAYLDGANLGNANLGEGAFSVDGGCERRGYSFFVLHYPNTLIIRGGCHTWATFEDAKAHYGDGYTSRGDRRECLARLTLMENEVKRRATFTKEGEK